MSRDNPTVCHVRFIYIIGSKLSATNETTNDEIMQVAVRSSKNRFLPREDPNGQECKVHLS